MKIRTRTLSKLKNLVQLETAFSAYTLDQMLGEGGAGRVYGGQDASGLPIALKVLTNQSQDKRQRFKNEIGFLARTTHPNIVKVLDYGVAVDKSISGPFYVMARYVGSLRSRMGNLEPEAAWTLFRQVLDGVEAAHLLGVTHRDLKPENILLDENDRAAVADFGVARFTEDQLHTLVETAPMQRLANFQYAAPEQRAVGQRVDERADIYALGLLLNELFTGVVPHGTEYRLIDSISAEHSYLDTIVALMIRQDPEGRPVSILDVKREIQRYRGEAVSLQNLRKIDQVIIPAGEAADPLAHNPPRIVNVDWNNGRLEIRLDQPISRDWVQALYNMGNYSSVAGHGPETFRFEHDLAVAAVDDRSAQRVLDQFKGWLPTVTRELKVRLEQRIAQEQAQRLGELQRERGEEEKRLAVNRSLKF